MSVNRSLISPTSNETLETALRDSSGVARRQLAAWASWSRWPCVWD